MKKTLVAAILGLVAASAVNAQSYIKLDTYNAVPAYQAVNYGPGSGGTVGQPISGPFTFGFFVAAGNVVTAVNSSFNGSGIDIPTGNGMALATGLNTTTPNVDGFANIATGSFTYNSAATANALVTIVVVAYNGADYASSGIRGHSLAFTYNATYVGNGPAPAMDGFSSFNVLPVPEPSTFALAGLGLAGLLIFRRRK
jgi:hypothetical protein